MFSKQSKIIGEKQNLSNYISGIDVYNSLILVKLSDPDIKREDYEITTHIYRPDLIAKDYYGSEDYSGFVMLQAARSLETYTKGSIIRLIPKSQLDTILKNM